MNLLLIEPSEIRADGRAVIGGARARHVHGVLRLEQGATLRAGIVDGPRGLAGVESVSPDSVTLDARALTESGERPAAPRVDLMLALPRPKVLKRLFAPIACLGVGRLVLVNAARVERYYFDSHALAPDVVRERLLEGLSQAGDTRLPRVSIHRSFRVLVEDELDALTGDGLRLVADVPRANAGESVRAAVAESTPATRALLAIGPEGGWVDFERGLLERHRFVTVKLGERTLRSDVACLVALGLLHDALG